LLMMNGLRFRIVSLWPNKVIAHRLLVLLEQVLEDQRRPALVPRLHQRATLGELSKPDRRKPELFGQGAHRSRRCLVVA
jgi:hypothetical protein